MGSVSKYFKLSLEFVKTYIEQRKILYFFDAKHGYFFQISFLEDSIGTSQL